MNLTNESKNNKIVENLKQQLEQVNNKVKDLEQEKISISTVISTLGLPTDGIIFGIENRKTILQQLPNIISKVSNPKEAYYLSKFVVAISAGLFDSALNYLWNETIKKLRARVLIGDLNYFYDVAVNGVRRKEFSSPEDLANLDDKTLIQGAFKVGLIEDIGHKHLEYIRFMRNYASAAHPNESELTEYNLMSWLDICVREIMEKPLSYNQIRINEILSTIKKESLSIVDAKTTVSFFKDLSKENCDSFAKGLFGLYIDKKSSQNTINNVNLLAPKLWQFVSEKMRKEFGVRNAVYYANAKKHEAKYSKNFLQIVNGLSYLTDSIKISSIKNAIDNLLTAHYAYENFSIEPTFAKELSNLIGEHGIPSGLDYIYIETLIIVFLTNGYGECWEANPIYTALIKKLNESQLNCVLKSLEIESIKSKLQFNLCQKKLKEMFELLEPSIVSEQMRSLFNKFKKEFNI